MNSSPAEKQRLRSCSSSRLTASPKILGPIRQAHPVGGNLLLPALVDGHIHLDKTHWGAPRLPYVEGRSVRERIAAERVARHKVALPIEARASALVRTLIANGSTRARSHVDIDNDVGLANLESVLKVREVYRDWIDIQLVAFPQSGVMTEDGAPDLLAAALRAGADLVGGLDPAGFDGDVKGQLDVVFGLAERFGKGIDIHLHDGGDVQQVIDKLMMLREMTGATRYVQPRGHSGARLCPVPLRSDRYRRAVVQRCSQGH